MVVHDPVTDLLVEYNSSPEIFTMERIAESQKEGVEELYEDEHYNLLQSDYLRKELVPTKQPRTESVRQPLA